MMLISLNGETQLVSSLSGYDEWTVVSSNVPPQPDDAAQFVNGAWVVPLDTLKARKRGQVDLYLYARFQVGFAPTTGPLTGHTLQVRDDTDRTNWLTSQAAYLAQINAGNGAVSAAEFRTADNVTITCSYSDGYSTLLGMGAWGKELMRKSWSLKDQINALTNPADVTAYDVAAAWEVA